SPRAFRLESPYVRCSSLPRSHLWRIPKMRPVYHPRATLPALILFGAAALFLLGPAAPGETKKDEAPKPPPKDATVLFDGKDLAGWTTLGGKPAGWKVENNYMEVVPGKGDIRTKETFGPDFELHVESWLPLMPAAKSQAG